MPDDRDAARARPAQLHPATNLSARAEDHAGIDRLADALVPALIAKLATLNVGEIEVREGDWRVRLRRQPGAGGPMYGRRSTDRPSRAHPGHEAHAHAPATPEPHRAARTPTLQGATGAASTNGRGNAGLAAVGPGRDGPSSGQGAATGAGQVATSPAVGVFQPDPKSVTGTRVRAGDRLGAVDMLGVPQEVVAPVDGIVVGVIVEAGTAVEYGQELVQLEPATPVEGR